MRLSLTILSVLMLCTGMVSSARAQSGIGQVEQFQKLQEQQVVDNRFMDYFQALAKNPRDPKLHLALAQVYLERDLLELSQESFQRALILDSQLAAAHYGLSKLYRKKKLKAHEVYEMEQAVATAPENGEYRYDLAVLYMEPDSFDFKKAKSQYKALQKMESPLATKLGKYLELE